MFLWITAWHSPWNTGWTPVKGLPLCFCIGLWRISPASEPPGSLSQMSMGDHMGFRMTVLNKLCRWPTIISCVTFWTTHFYHTHLREGTGRLWGGTYSSEVYDLSLYCLTPACSLYKQSLHCLPPYLLLNDLSPLYSLTPACSLMSCLCTV